MPLMRIDMLKGRQPEEIQALLDISYRVMLKAFDAPEGDRYQIVTQHEPYEMQVLDTGLGFKRTDQVVVFSLTTRPRTEPQKQAFYHDLVAALHDQLNMRPEDVMINLTVNTDADWSFGRGQAQFLTGDL
ncbi:tautomerase family protein [Lacticaseibacillus thailandensis]|uniref:MsaD protein n=1 Tax=Lacticaseibacillus thailandensis DSM 22698 = JCM 13996 TaxID=1423810 RepID=A0A0R2C567_9LACO|nr:tautomerase family protein [Lacticaseibacillus thailandensis]KRM86474.1 msaD protein [Lacticaseibacillus thailandensis DSM 22698 = JCM 13996]